MIRLKSCSDANSWIYLRFEVFNRDPFVDDLTKLVNKAWEFPRFMVLCRGPNSNVHRI
jgi:hypothetical protein